jgi:predicted Fe-S protein YdhL (DUF1289 family)
MTPCVKRCNAKDGICTGCGRTLDEIARWGRMTQAEREAVMTRLNQLKHEEASMIIVNMTQHPATPEQRAAGVVDLEGPELARLKAALTFDELPTEAEIISRAKSITRLACAAIGDEDIYEQMAREAMGDEDIGFTPAQAMIGGALWLMGPLATELMDHEIEPVFAFTKRETEEQVQPDGSVRKLAAHHSTTGTNPACRKTASLREALQHHNHNQNEE